MRRCREPSSLQAAGRTAAGRQLPFRLTRRQWQAVELYDEWLGGRELQVYEGDDGLIEDGEPEGEAGRVTWLINLVLANGAMLGYGDVGFDASRPAAAHA